MKILFENALILSEQGPISGGFVSVDGSRIAEVSETRPNGSFDRVINCAGKLLAPAFYNIHCHAAMTIFRGIGEDLPLARWLEEKIYPAEDRLTSEAVRIGSRLAAAEMLRGGCVSFSDMYFFSDETAKAVLDIGMKANISRCLVSFDENATVKGDSRFDEAAALAREYNGSGDGRVRIDMAVHAEYTNKTKYCREVAEYAHANDLGMQVHISETRAEHEECMARNGGRTPVEFLLDNGILIPSSARSTATAAHCVWVTDRDMELLAANNVTVAHNPVSNLKLASGVAPVAKMLEHGVNVGLGTDGAASNNTLSVLRELQCAALIHKGVNLKADIIPTRSICEMASAAGAKAQGRPDCGTIRIGNRADIILIDLDELNNIPMYDPYSALAFSVNSRDVTLTMCDGRILYENGELTTIDEAKLRREAKELTAHYFD